MRLSLVEFLGSCCCVSGKIRYLYDTLKVFVLARSSFLSFLAIVHRSLCPAYRKGPQESQLGRYKSSTAGCVVFEKINPAVVGLSDCPVFPVVCWMKVAGSIWRRSWTWNLWKAFRRTTRMRWKNFRVAWVLAL